MGIGVLGGQNTVFKKKHQWLFSIIGITSDGSGNARDGIATLPPLKSARPTVTFKEMEIQHLTETVYYPQKPQWKTIELVLYDLKTKEGHPVFEWLKTIYNPEEGTWSPTFKEAQPADQGPNAVKRTARLQLLDGCGCVIEKWIFDNAWPQVLDFGSLDMASSEFITANITLRYDRAYIESDQTNSNETTTTDAANRADTAATASPISAGEPLGQRSLPLAGPGGRIF